MGILGSIASAAVFCDRPNTFVQVATTLVLRMLLGAVLFSFAAPALVRVPSAS
jgi:hypothetical protein